MPSADNYNGAVPGLPDPHYQAEFYADVPAKRLIAWVIDIVLILAMTLLVIVFTAFIGIFFAGFLFVAIGFAYRVVTLASRSATLGMRMVSIELRNARGEPLDFGQALLHTAGYYVSMSMVIVQLVSIIMMLTSPRGQGLTDVILGTAAVNRRARS